MQSTIFSTKLDKILERLDQFDLSEYGRTRNFIDGKVSHLSSYISRGVISTRYVLKNLKERKFDLSRIEKFLQELAWRDYWQQIWRIKGSQIDTDLRSEQVRVQNGSVSKNLIEGNSGIEAIDKAIHDFYKTGYLHNHIRMYIASMACNVAQSHWKLPAKWMYYHLLDADWASDALSWQWVAGTYSRKKYYANQDNINRFCYSNQKNTFLDVEYSSFSKMDVPEELKETTIPQLQTSLPTNKEVILDNNKPVFLYNFYNLDPFWKKDVDVNGILLLEPSHFKKYPVASKTIDFIVSLSENIKGLQLFTGEFYELHGQYPLGRLFSKNTLSMITIKEKL